MRGVSLPKITASNRKVAGAIGTECNSFSTPWIYAIVNANGRTASIFEFAEGMSVNV
jgi:hypothetical protein